MYQKLYGAVYVLIQDKKGKYCLLKRVNTGWMDNYYAFPSGHIDNNESPTNAAVREVKEEVGLNIKREFLKPILTMYRIDIDRVYIDLFFTYVDKIILSELQNHEVQKHSNIGFYNIDELDLPIVPNQKLGLECINKGLHYIEVINN